MRARRFVAQHYQLVTNSFQTKKHAFLYWIYYIDTKNVSFRNANLWHGRRTTIFLPLFKS